MSGALDLTSRQLALNLLDRFGKSASYVHVAASTYNAATGETSAAETTQTISIYIDSPNSSELRSGCVASDQIAFFAALGMTAEPTPNDRITIDGVDHTVMPVSRVWSGEQVALYRVKVVKA